MAVNIRVAWSDFQLLGGVWGVVGHVANMARITSVGEAVFLGTSCGLFQGSDIELGILIGRDRRDGVLPTAPTDLDQLTDRDRKTAFRHLTSDVGGDLVTSILVALTQSKGRRLNCLSWSRVAIVIPKGSKHRNERP